MSLADKLIYLNDTKQQLRTALNDAGAAISESDPFRDYVNWVEFLGWELAGGLVSLFDDGETGFLFGPLPYFQDTAGTTEATWGDPVGLVPDLSDNGNDFTQATATARPVLREIDGIACLEFDGTDDLVSTTLPAITDGTLVIAGINGIWIDDGFNFGGGDFEIGPTSYTSGPAGILPVIGDLIVGGTFVIDRQLTAAERDKVVLKLKSLGAPGVFELGPETWDSPSLGSGWVDNGDGSWTADGISGDLTVPGALEIGRPYLIRYKVSSTGTIVIYNGVTGGVNRGSGDYLLVTRSATPPRVQFRANSEGVVSTVSNVSVREITLV